MTRPHSLLLESPAWGVRIAGRSAASPPLAARQAAAWFARLLGGGVAAVAALNWLVNPWGLYSPRLVQPRVAALQYEKCATLRRQVYHVHHRVARRRLAVDGANGRESLQPHSLVVKVERDRPPCSPPEVSHASL